MTIRSRPRKRKTQKKQRMQDKHISAREAYRPARGGHNAEQDRKHENKEQGKTRMVKKPTKTHKIRITPGPRP